MMAEQIWRFRTPYPSWGWFAPTPPGLEQAYCHHPFGMYWVLLPFLSVFGHADFVPPLPAVLMSIATPFLLYGLGKRAWGHLAGVSAAMAFTVVPIAVGFSNFHNLEGLCIFGSLVFFYGAVQLEHSQKSRYLYLSLTGIIITTAADWIGFVTIGLVLGGYFLLRFAIPNLAPKRLKTDAMTRLWATSVVVLAASLVLWLALFVRADKLSDWLSSGTQRSSGGHVPLASVLKERASWIDFSFGPVIVFIGKALVPLLLLRLVWTRRIVDLFAISVLIAATIQYVGFKQGADVHIFWPHYFALYFALAMGSATQTTLELATRIQRRFFLKERGLILIAPMLVGLGIPALHAPDAIRSLRIWRETGGRFNDRGAFIQNNKELLHVIRNLMRPLARAGLRTEAHASALWGWEHDWSLAHVMVQNGASAPAGNGERAVWVGRASGLSADEQRNIARQASVRVFGDVWLVDRRITSPGIAVFNFGEHEPSNIEALWLGGYAPVRSKVPTLDAAATWELQTHLGMFASPPPFDSAPSDIEHQRLQQNIARAASHDAIANTHLAHIRTQLDESKAHVFQNGLHLLGVRANVGAERAIEIWWQAPDAIATDFTMAVTSEVVSKNPWSLFPVDAPPRNMMQRAALPTKLWKPNFVYVWSFPAMHRVGREKYAATLHGEMPPIRADGAPTTELVELN
jgi:4-amino-4-deoxy-L-arabinose transferase-like glycosyltransferase